MSAESKEFRRAKQAAKKQLQNLALPPELSLEMLQSKVERERAISITVRPAGPDDDPLVTGSVLFTANHAVITYPADASPHRQIKVLCHEFAHLIFGHVQTDPFTNIPDDMSEMLQLLDPSMIKAQLLRRRCFDNPAELEAEILADMLSVRLTWSSTRRSPTPDAFGRVFG
ncbi:ImmA/IrrE family metallo-endopeptidase (plasmid) [Arthrobacter sp. TES]|nr:MULTISPECIES: ImmA/IrrE family metallo-endopeptidase [Micrococcaceae]ERI35618.1 hypothetical protein M707_20715 [Arthrobacter sp. AK-YN10]QOI65970.1 ImmA/IrrE family metallo-endopeptidase [Arthrobacter sp. TES]WOC63381.1 ImmA/IrrE family metallo-endopeptidase [Paenarthrobacter sp. AT5]